MMCSFAFEDKPYQVSDEACAQAGNIQLPDGRVLQVDGWLESMPPQPCITGVTTEVSSRPVFEAVAV